MNTTSFLYVHRKTRLTQQTSGENQHVLCSRHELLRALAHVLVHPEVGVIGVYRIVLTLSERLS